MQNVIMGECQHAGEDLKECELCGSSGYLKVIPGADGQPVSCKRCAGTSKMDAGFFNSGTTCGVCDGSGLAGLV